MGNICGALDALRAHSMEIDKILARDGKAKNDEVKLLLLGPGESGKSTLFKQMKILAREGGYTEEDLKGYKFIIFSNCITQMQVLLEHAIHAGVQFANQQIAERAESVRDLPLGGDGWSAKAAEDIAALWADEGIQETYLKRDKYFQLNESAPYFFDNIVRFSEPNYTPTKQDVLRARVRSTGIEEAEFKFEELRFRLFDVGGQRSERRKWIHCFEDVTAVLFTASLSDYDQSLREDPKQNRMRESLLLFDEIVNSPWFRETPVVLFLNKKDLFVDKVTRVDLNVCFPNYKGGKEYENALTYIKARFNELPNVKREIYMHETCAIDTKNVEVVFRAVKDIVLKLIMEEAF